MKIDLHTFLLFIGYGRSGSTTVASVLNHHPNVLISNEMNIILKRKYDRRKIITKIRKNAINNPIKWHSINYNFKGVNVDYNKNKSLIHVLGDKQANRTTIEEYRNDAIIWEFYNKIPELKFIHVIRNPFDIITTKYLKNKKKYKKNISNTVREFFDLTKTVHRVKKNFLVYDIHLEDLINDHKGETKKLLDWVELRYNAKILNDCTHFLLNKKSVTRDKHVWTDGQKAKVKNFITGYDWFKDYEW